MNTLIFATNNHHKAEEVRAILAGKWEIQTLIEAGIDKDIPEPHNTLEANASEKSSVIYKMTDKDCFSEDTGLEVEALEGEPGVRSARYAGEGRSFEDNINKLIDRLRGFQNRKARFRTVISLFLNGIEYQFEGVCDGYIIEENKGKAGFGYDPVFVPDGDTRTFAEMELAEKNLFSHRKKAMEKLIGFLEQRSGSDVN